jgi:integrase
MPAEQRGTTVKLSSSWGVRWVDEHGRRHRQAGFVSKTKARAWLDDKVDEVAEIKRGVRIAPKERPTVRELVDLFLELHDVDPATTRKLRSQLGRASERFGDDRPDEISRVKVEAWRRTLSAGNRHDVFRAFRQLLAWAVDRQLAATNAAAGIRNPKRKRHERRPISPFESWDEVEAIGAKLDARYRAIPVFAVGTGLRPEEWIALERADVDREAGLVHVRRRFTQGVLKQGGKTDGSVRAVPLRQRVLDALDEVPVRIDSPLLFPAPRGGYIDLERFRNGKKTARGWEGGWNGAVRAAGLEHRRPNDCRHTFATWAIEDGRISLVHLASIMGTSVRELEDTYARWLKRTDDQLRASFDLYDAAAAAR